MHSLRREIITGCCGRAQQAGVIMSQANPALFGIRGIWDFFFLKMFDPNVVSLDNITI